MRLIRAVFATLDLAHTMTRYSLLHPPSLSVACLLRVYAYRCSSEGICRDDKLWRPQCTCLPGLDYWACQACSEGYYGESCEPCPGLLAQGAPCSSKGVCLDGSDRATSFLSGEGATKVLASQQLWSSKATCSATTQHPPNTTYSAHTLLLLVALPTACREGVVLFAPNTNSNPITQAPKPLKRLHASRAMASDIASAMSLSRGRTAASGRAASPSAEP